MKNSRVRDEGWQPKMGAARIVWGEDKNDEDERHWIIQYEYSQTAGLLQWNISPLLNRARRRMHFEM